MKVVDHENNLNNIYKAMKNISKTHFFNGKFFGKETDILD